MAGSNFDFIEVEKTMFQCTHVNANSFSASWPAKNAHWRVRESDYSLVRMDLRTHFVPL
jgi:hypothetical protein